MTHKAPLVRVTFLDHCMTQGDKMQPIQCEAVGFLVKEDKTALYIATWVCDNVVESHNSEIFCIIKHKGLKIKKVRS